MKTNWRKAFMLGGLCVLFAMAPLSSYAEDMPDPEVSVGDSEREYVPMIREDRVWEYKHVRIPDSWYHKMHFSGEMEKFGRKYHVFKQCDTSLDDENTYYSLLREENGKVYMVNKNYGIEQPDKSEIYEGTVVDTESEEILLYDFTKDKGDSVLQYWTNFSGSFLEMPMVFFSNQMTIDETEYITIDGEDCLVQKFDQSTTVANCPPFVEGVGCIEDGMLDIMMLSNFPAGVDLRVHLSAVYDGDGNVIFRPSDLNKNGIDNIDDEYCSESSQTEYYDLQGMRVDSPVKGSIYIVRDNRNAARKVVIN